MEKRDVEAALQTAVEVFEGSSEVKEAVEYVKALLDADKERQRVGRVIGYDGDGKPVMAWNEYPQVDALLYAELPRLKDSEFQGFVNDLQTLTKAFYPTPMFAARLAIFLRDFERAVRGEK